MANKGLWRIAAVFVALTLSTIFFIDAQTTEFSSDYEEFVQQIDAIFKTTGDKKKASEFTKELEAFMFAPDVDEKYKNRIIADCNKLRKIKARPYPNYSTCISTYYELAKNTKIQGANYQVWCEIADLKMTSGSRRLSQITDYYEATLEYLKDYALCKTASVRWRHMAGDDKFRNVDGQLVIDVPETRITCLSQGDSIEVLETSGSYYTDEKKWMGKKGVVTWERVDLPRSQVNATFDEYEINMKNNSFTIENTKFINSNYFSHPLYGTLEHKVTSRKTTIGNKYPKFVTTGEHMEIPNIFRNINYSGGFTQMGSSFQGSGTPEAPARIEIYRNDTLFVEAKSTSFLFGIDKIEGASSAIIIHLNDEVISHPGLLFRYMDKERVMHLVRNNDGLERSLYYDSYHKVSMDIEFIRWKIDEPEMELRMIDGAARGLALFESLAYYRESYYYEIQGMDMVHPFQNLADFYHYNGGQPFYLDDYASYLMISASSLRKQILLYSFDSFLDFDDNTGLITPRQRMFDYLLFRLGKKDYDVIRFESVTGGKVPNGVLNLRNYDINLNGVTGVAISDNQNVALYPADGKIILKENRDFKFDGQVDAGMLSLVGNGFYFSYDDYRIELKNIDEMHIRVTSNEKDAYGRTLLAHVGNTLNNLSGFLEIDEPDNKSGIKKNPQYPRLTSTKESYVYYDDPKIQGGKYKRDFFYFAVDPFVFENINDIRFDNTNFAGVLHSDIFPPIRQELKIRQEDYSLGFVQTSPAEGYPVYNGRATFFHDVDLSNKGLHGIGDLHYVASRSSSEDFLFLPQEAKGVTYDFNVDKTTEGTTFPGVELGRNQSYGDDKHGQTDLRFLPYEEQLTVENTTGTFLMFPTTRTQGTVNGYECDLSGSLTVTPNGLKGFGQTNLMQASLEGEIMEFTDHTITADTSYFTTYRYDEYGQKQTMTGALRQEILKDYDRASSRLYSTTAAQYPETMFKNSAIREDTIIHRIWGQSDELYRLLMDNSMISVLDFEKREGYFTYKAGIGSEWTSKTIQYKTRLKHVTWDMEHNRQIMGTKGSKGNRFVCTKERGDSLNFYAPLAIFDGFENTLTCEEVKNIETADVNVILDPEELVVIREGGVMDALDKSVLEMKTDSTYHKIYDAKIKIEGAKKYTGIGTYDFENSLGETYQVFMNEITSNDDGRSTATGSFYNPINFDQYFRYKGNATIQNGRQLLEFDGAAQPIHDCQQVRASFVRFKSVIDPKFVLIPISEDKINNWDNAEIHRNFFIRKDSTHVYSSFLEDRVDYSDISILKGYGNLYYNHTYNSFDIASDEKRLDPADALGPLLRFIPGESMIKGSGKIDLGVMMPDTKPISFYSAGNIQDDRTKNELTLNVLTFVDFFFSSELATMLYQDVISSNAPKCDSASYRYTHRLEELFDTSEIKKIKVLRNHVLEKEEMLPEDAPMFTFDNMELLWNTPKRAYICDTAVNLMMIRGLKVDKTIRIKSEFVVRKTGSSVDIYMTFDDLWYFFGCKPGNLQVLSSNKDFNTALQRIDPKERRSKARGIVYTLAPDSRRKRFLANFGPKAEVEADIEEDVETGAEEETFEDGSSE